jgi:Fe-S cluster biogenesis protein NfuA
LKLKSKRPSTKSVHFCNGTAGDVQYIGFKDGIVYVRMGGACEGCAYMDSDISAGVEIILMEEVPGVIQVKTDEIPDDLMKAYEDRMIAEQEKKDQKK